MDRVETTLLTDSAHGSTSRSATGLSSAWTASSTRRCIIASAPSDRVDGPRLDVPVTVLGSASKIVSEGFVFENEFRPGSEVMAEPADGFDVENPAYDATPVELLESVITDEGREQF